MHQSVVDAKAGSQSGMLIFRGLSSGFRNAIGHAATLQGSSTARMAAGRSQADPLHAQALWGSTAASAAAAAAGMHSQHRHCAPVRAADGPASTSSSAHDEPQESAATEASGTSSSSSCGAEPSSSSSSSLSSGGTQSRPRQGSGHETVAAAAARPRSGGPAGSSRKGAGSTPLTAGFFRGPPGPAPRLPYVGRQAPSGRRRAVQSATGSALSAPLLTSASSSSSSGGRYAANSNGNSSSSNGSSSSSSSSGSSSASNTSLPSLDNTSAAVRPSSAPMQRKLQQMLSHRKQSRQQAETVITDSSSSSSTSTFRSSSNTSSSASSSNGPSPGFVQRALNANDLQTLRDKGIAALRDMQRVPDFTQLQQSWDEAQQQLPAAFQRLLAVSLSGPVKVVVFDFETTGTSRTAEIIELAAVTGDGQTFPAPGHTSLIRPLGEISPGASKVNGIKWEDVRDQPPLPVVMLQWVEWLTQQCSEAGPGGRSTLVLAGHNIKTFDVKFLITWLDALRLSEGVLVVRKADPTPELPWMLIDTHCDMGMQAKLKLRLKDGKLQSFREHYRILPDQAAHRALSDVLVNLEVFKHLAALLLKLEKGCNLSADQLAAQFLEERLPSALPRQPSSTRSLAPASLGTPIDQQQQQQYNQSAGPVTAAAAHGHQPAQQGLQQDHPLTQREAQPPQDMQVAENAAERVHQAAAQQEAAGMQADAAVHQHQQQQPDSPQVSSEAILAQQPQQEAAGGSNVITMLQQMQEMLRRGDCSQAEIIWLGQQLMASAEANGAPAAADEHAERVVSFLDSSSSSSLGSRTLSSTAGSSSGPDSQPRSPSATGSSRDSPRRVRTGGSSSSSSFLSFIAADSNSLGPLDPEVVEAAVAQSLESLPAQDLSWDQEQLAHAWPLLGDPLARNGKVLSTRMYEKLMASEFTNHLQVLQHAPTIVEYRSSIPVEGAGSGSWSEAGGLLDDSADAAAGGDDASGDIKHLISLRAKCLATSSPRPYEKKNAAGWSALFEVPTDPPSAGPVGVQVSFYLVSRTAAHARQMAMSEYNKAKAAVDNGTEVHLKCRIKPYDAATATYKFAYRPEPTMQWTWESTSTPTVQISWDGAATSSSSSDRGDSDSPQLQPVYRRVKEVLPDDWVGKGNSKGIIPPLLAAVQGLSADVDMLPASIRQKHDFMGGFVDDLKGVHQPTSLQQYERACKGLAFRELAMVQAAQMLTRYRLTCMPEGTVIAAASILLPEPDPAPEQKKAAKSASKPKARQDKSATNGKATGGSSSSSAGRSSSYTTTSSSSDSDDADDVPLSLRMRAACSSVQSPLLQQESTAYCIHDKEAVAAAKRVLPFELTSDQQRVLQEILGDMQGPRAMLRLLQGDVGCGKTMVAILACLAVAQSGYQALLFAPTELLATQHYDTLQRLAEQLPMSMRPRIDLLVGSCTATAKKISKGKIASGETRIIISTQAALWVNQWSNLALIVVDEQHKLGVKQRERLTHGLTAPPHMLLMSATPIPRTLAILQYGGMTLSSIRELPLGRSPVETYVVNDDEQDRKKVYEDIKQEISSGGRAYIVCPLVNDSDAMEGVRTVEAEYMRLSSSGIFGDSSKCGKLHGKMDPAEKEAVLARFRSGETPVLIASTVVEVGVDVPEASIMLVEAARNFGLAQLHQLRGRVGRGSKASRCYLMAPAADAPGADVAAERLQVLEDCHDGLDVAEKDLRFRGPGDLWSGTKQSGKQSHLSAITMRQLQADPHIMEHARMAAAEMIRTIGQNPQLKAALLAYGFMFVPEGETMAVARYGVSGM